MLFHGCPSSPRCRGSLLCSERGLLLLRSPRSGAAPPRRVGPSRTGDRTPVPCTSRQILTRCTTRDIRLFSDFKSRLGFAHSPVTKKFTHCSQHLLHFSHLALGPICDLSHVCVTPGFDVVFFRADCSSPLLTTSSPSPRHGLGSPGSRVCLCGPRVPVPARLHMAGAWWSEGRPRGREVQTFLVSLLGKLLLAVFALPLLM